MRRLLLRLLNVIRHDAAERELARELDSHLRLLEDEYLRRGMTDAQARVAARLAIGNVESTKDRLGLVLASIGIYGVTAYSVVRRTQELGIRMALGAERSQIVRMILGQGFRLAAIGAAIGVLLAAGVSRLLSAFLFGRAPLDPIVFGGSAALFTLAALVACYGPSRRATRIDPLAALRHQ